ncbi:MAG: HEAT repeat domain-containing protein [Coriobacteriia bacterium]
MMKSVESVVRALATAAKTLRLYPPSSPIPRQSAEAAAESLAGAFRTVDVVPLAVAREGFSYGGSPISSAGANDLADILTSHGVAEVDFRPGTGPEDLIGFLTNVLRSPDEVRAAGGMGALLASSGIESITVSDVSLTIVEADTLGPGDDIDEFLRELASDPAKLTLWLTTATGGDPAALAEGLAELAAASGPGGLERLVESLSTAFLNQQPDGKDALLGLAVHDSEAKGIMGAVLGSLSSTDIASSLAGGLFGKNMLSMSSMLSGLPLGGRMDTVLSDVRPLLEQYGHGSSEITFLDHMLEVRQKNEPEIPLAELRPDYARVAAAARVADGDVARVRNEVQTSSANVNRRSVATMLQLLDQQRDFKLYCKTLDGLASTVPALFEMRDLDLASKVIDELTTRESGTDLPWPELAARLKEAIAKATGKRSMVALLHAVVDDIGYAERARDVLRRAGGAAQSAFVEEALSLRDIDGLAIAQEVLGRRLLDLLIAHAPQAQWFHVAPIARKLAAEGDSRSSAAIEAILKRTDEQSRQEAAKGLAEAGTLLSLTHLKTLVRDASPEVALIAIRAMGRSPVPGAAAALSQRFDELDCDGKDFVSCREILGALARCPDPGATAALERIAARKALIKRGHFAEISDLSKQALAARSQGGPR